MKRGKPIPLWQILGIVLILGIPLLIIVVSPKIQEPELLWHRTTNDGQGMVLKYYPSENQTCFEYLQDGQAKQICFEGRKTDLIELLDNRLAELNEPKAQNTTPKTAEYLEMEHVNAVLSEFTTKAKNCTTYANSATTAQGDENTTNFWMSKYEENGCPTVIQDACQELDYFLEKRSEAPYWYSPTSEYAGNYVTTAAYNNVFTSFKTMECNVEDLNIPSMHLKCLEKNAKIEELKSYPEKYHVQPDPIIMNQLQWDYIDTCLTDTFK